jgi:DNA polymerase
MKFQGMIRVGMLGDTGRIFGQEIADSLGVSIPGFLARNAAGGRTNEQIVYESCPPNIDLDTHACHCACAFSIINTFRNNKPKIPELWDTCNTALDMIYQGKVWKLGTNDVIETRPEGFLLPNGMLIRYVELHQKQKRRGFDYSVLKNRKKGEREKIYGGKCVENLVQALSRIVITDDMLKLKDEGIKVVHQVHDEIIAVAPDANAEGVYHRMGEIMSTPPVWAPDLPLASEGGWADRYEK